MKKLFALLTAFALVALMGAGCALTVSPEEEPVTVPSEEVSAPTPEDIGEVDVFEEDGAEEEASAEASIGEVTEEAGGPVEQASSTPESPDE